MSITEINLEKALKKAEKISREHSTKIFVIIGFDEEEDDSEPCYHIDENGTTRIWEEVEAIYENGILIKTRE
ncbi:hypothetical protein [Chryseobacterium oncorhynchi]|uniref:Uncharacterized protein n=1 Tax=Chryseobacterium oncorhynchi TaxID=741074 RepID=A0A316WN49_9FLAO|nr:hypothetical protein [Chryseobacterium oncorhynchi]PWN59950.1 hypothetical protein C1638_020500 [Chryseobacterium oncorhynchi]